MANNADNQEFDSNLLAWAAARAANWPHLFSRLIDRYLELNDLTEDEYFCTEEGARTGVSFENTSETEPLVCLRYFGPEVNPQAPAIGAHKKNKFN